ncbi:MAG: 50S ribosomal protein L33 [Candidatus Pacebacteria bacterium CG_4_10_14_0_8_um_filter_43_12]|nr:MAG: 50S ribosomal protein L33 [Candidatus Pacebacteria bacterium CG10_big_fil_rev_8_21_14_0_10_44_11]PIY79150.1 MAG: 50S ribosomal protein L33 [Candidatus Pacebacteria bacterium CG_4_10_14_0_8_um_filter_43_12]
MPKAKKGPRQSVGLQCKVCKTFGYLTEYNKNNEQLKKQTSGEATFPINKYCSNCKKHTPHIMAKKLK